MKNFNVFFLGSFLVIFFGYFGFDFFYDISTVHPTTMPQSIWETMIFDKYGHLLGGVTFKPEHLLWFENKTDFVMLPQWFTGITDYPVFYSAIIKCYLNAFGGENLAFSFEEIKQLALYRKSFDFYKPYDDTNFYLRNIQTITDCVIPKYLNNVSFSDIDGIYIDDNVKDLVKSFKKDFEEPNPSEINIKKFIIIAGIIVGCAFYVYITGNLPW